MKTIKLNTIKFDLGGGDVTKKEFKQLEKRVETITDMAPEDLDTLREVAKRIEGIEKNYLPLTAGYDHMVKGDLYVLSDIKYLHDIYIYSKAMGLTISKNGGIDLYAPTLSSDINITVGNIGMHYDGNAYEFMADGVVRLSAKPGADNYILGNDLLRIHSLGNGRIDFGQGLFEYTKGEWSNDYKSLITTIQKTATITALGGAMYIYAGTDDKPLKLEIGSKKASYIQFNKDATAKAYGDYTFKGNTTFEKPIVVKEIDREGVVTVNAQDVKLNSRRTVTTEILGTITEKSWDDEDPGRCYSTISTEIQLKAGDIIEGGDADNNLRIYPENYDAVDDYTFRILKDGSYKILWYGPYEAGDIYDEVHLCDHTITVDRNYKIVEELDKLYIEKEIEIEVLDTPTKTITKTILVPLKDIIEEHNVAIAELDLKIGDIDTVLDNIIGG